MVSSFLLLFFTAVAPLPTTDDNQLSDGDTSEICTEIFSNVGLNYSSFSKGVAHGIHSLSLEEIRDAKRDNIYHDSLLIHEVGPRKLVHIF